MRLRFQMEAVKKVAQFPQDLEVEIQSERVEVKRLQGVSRSSQAK